MERVTPCTDPRDREALSRAVARTYRGDLDGWQRVQEYNDFLEYQGRHPNKGSAAIANALELPRGRVRPWTNGSRPDPVRGLQTAAANGWLDLTWDGGTMRAFTVAVAWIFSGGSIDDHFVPAFAVESRTKWLAEALLDQVGTGGRDRHADEEGRATEVVPVADGSVLGRVLLALGAPQGEKATAGLQLPAWLGRAPERLRLAFARMYVTNRRTSRDDRPNFPVSFREKRSATYRQELRALLEGLVEGEAVGGDSETLYLTPAAAGRLDQFPALES